MKDWWRKLKLRFKKKVLPHLIASLGLGLIRVLMATCKVKVNGVERFVETTSKHPTMVMLWHNRLSLVVWALSKKANHLFYAAVVSKSRDGMLLSKIADKYRPNGKIITVSHKARHNALRTMVQELKKGEWVLLVTPDGPRGPRYQIKPGAPIAAKISGAACVPFSWSASRFWQFKTWDKMLFPKPFSRIVIDFGEPFFVDKDQLDLPQEKLTAHTQANCEALTSNSNHWPK